MLLHWGAVQHQKNWPGSSMHILITVNAAWNIWNFRKPLIEALLQDGHQLTLIAPFDESVAALKGVGCRFVPLEMDIKGLNPFKDFRLTARMNRQFRRVRPDAILSFTIKNNLFGAFAAKWLGIPFIPTVTGLGTAFLSGGILQRVAEFLYRRAFTGLPTVFFQNADDRDLFISSALIGSEQARLLPGSGIDLERFSAAPYPAGGPTIFLMISRLLRDKGVQEYVDAARIVKQQRDDCVFQLLGAAGAANRSAFGIDSVDEWEAEGVIEYLGTTDDVRSAIERAHCVVLPSYREGAPRTLIEAAAMARPLIATDVPGCRDVVAHGATGYLCDVKSARSLADACAAFLALRAEARAEMGRAGRAKMQAEYDVKLVIEAYRRAVREATR